MKDRNANFSVRINVRVKDLRREPHRRRVQRVVLRENESGDEDAVLERAALRPRDGRFPLEEVVLK